MDGDRTAHNARATFPAPPGLIRLRLEVGGVPVYLNTDLESNEWLKACVIGGFSRVSFVGKLMLGAGLTGGKAYSAKNQNLQLFGGKVSVGSEFSDGPIRYGTSALAFFRRVSLYRLVVGVTGNANSASTFARLCRHALHALVGNPGQAAETGTLVWTGNGDRVTLRHSAADAYLIHELTTR